MKFRFLSTLAGLGRWPPARPRRSRSSTACATTSARPTPSSRRRSCRRPRTTPTCSTPRAASKASQIEIVAQDHGNEPQRGIECYEKLKREGVMMFDILSTPVSRAVLPRAMADGNILLQSFVGRGDAIDGDVFKWVFPIGPTYWGQVANDIQYIKNQNKGNLKGVKIGFIYPDYAFGQEPIPVLKTLAAKEGFELQLFPNPLPGKRPGGGVDADPPLQPRLGDQLEPVGACTWWPPRDEAQRHPDGQATSSSTGSTRSTSPTSAPAEAKGLKRGTNVRGRQEPPADQADRCRPVRQGQGQRRSSRT